MARIGSACPREGSARTQALPVGLGTRLKFAFTADERGERPLQAAAVLHLLAIAAAVLGPASPPLPIFPTLTGLALVVLALVRMPVAAVSAALGPVMPDIVERRAFDLERQSQRLVEIADAASRARREAEMRGHLWAELTARMSHELRTPLNAVIGFSDLMSAELFGPLGHDRYRDYTRHIRECSRSLLKCTEDTLALTSSLAKSEPGETLQTLRLDDLLREALAFHAAGIATRDLCVVLPVRNETCVLGEARPMRQILINLVAEAIERGRRGASITISVVDDGDSLLLSILVEKVVPRADVGQAPLTICIARVLLEQQGSALIESDDHERWQATTCLQRPAQSDFFTGVAA